MYYYPRLDARIILIVDGFRMVLLPFFAVTLNLANNRLNQGPNLRLTLDELEGEALACVPGNMAVHQPGSVTLVFCVL